MGPMFSAGKDRAGGRPPGAPAGGGLRGRPVHPDAAGRSRRPAGGRRLLAAGGHHDARPLPPARGDRRHRRLVHGGPHRRARALVPRRRHDGRGRLLDGDRHPPRGRDLVPAPRRALHLPDVLGPGPPRRGGGDGRLLVPRARARCPPLRGVRGLGPRHPRPARRRERDRRRGGGARPRHDRGRRHLPAGRRRVLRPALLHALPDAPAAVPLLRRPGQPRLRDPGGQALLRRLHPAPQRPLRPRARVVLLAGAGGGADDRPRHEPDAPRHCAPSPCPGTRRRPGGPRRSASSSSTTRCTRPGPTTRRPRRRRCARSSRRSTPRPVSTSSSTATTTCTSAPGRSAASST